jgi:iron complex transport system substrate-binding protein
MNRTRAQRGFFTACALMCLCTSFLSWGCRNQQTNNTNLEHDPRLSNVDDVKPKKSPLRIVSLAPSITETLFALGVQKRLVGVTRYCDYPKQAQSIKRVGDLINPSVETILSLKPDLVITTVNPGTRRVLASLPRHGVKVLWVNLKSIEDVRKSFVVLGKALLIEKRGRELAKRFQSELNAARQTVPTIANKPQVLIIFGHRPLIVAGPNTFADNLLHLAGAQNAAAESPHSYPKWTLENLLEVNPTVIIDAYMGSQPSGVAKLRPRWMTMKAINAVARGHVHVWNGNLLHRPGPRLPKALAQLIDLIYPNKRKPENH